MNLKYYKPCNSSRRNTILPTYKKTYGCPLKSKTKGMIKTSGRNNQGYITISSRGGGGKRLYRKVNYKNLSRAFLTEALEYDPNRSALLARLYSISTKKHFYVISPQEIQKGHIYNRSGIKLGSWISLKYIPLGSKIHCVGTTFRPQKAILQRSAGTYAQLIQKFSDYCLIKLSSGKIKRLQNETKAVIGSVSNEHYSFRILGKAGRNRRLGFRPKTRGVAMNPVDHPHGGGEGRSSGGRPSVTPWSKPAHGKKTGVFS